MKAYIFPGQGAQFPGMGKDLYEKSPAARELFRKADSVLGFNITEIMFSGTEEDLRQTRVTQPAIFLHSTILAAVQGPDFRPDMVAGHSLGEFSALVANRTLEFEDALVLVSKRAIAMQKACEMNPSTMAAIIGADDKTVEEVCAAIDEIVVPANYNSPGQIVISGTNEGIDKAIEVLKSRSVKRTLKLAVGGAFHSPLMEPARAELEEAIRSTKFNDPICPVYQNVTARPATDPGIIRSNLVAQLTAPVLWTQTVLNMIADGADSFTEVGPGCVLQGLIRKINSSIVTGGVVV
ncbi:MAG TPA: ACP S-malonyltransferase [Bacteroidales bacterium]|jgi:[acyl-carrier-protein] S-malonyltransferase|nr:ACP S-malonyltransferase [Bacteroidales bacterium]OQB61924.1 MAG: Malonyl CoA-acyl carrier protein transacylase [Bacteroidetes bacterium ADurb.Bin145]HOU01892.1 ACP S-malonyltransferase [Bacteroidales bacterium]HQG63182.1 ACP S-malonyltransferase [Bacteroidales bacterium]HQK67334.1 ACP S-malonyltransferase [Bacteroidales bacterium]